MKDDLDPVRRVVEKLYTADLIEDGILSVVGHVVCHYWRQSISLHGVQTSSEHNPVRAREDVLVLGQIASLVPLQGSVEQTFTDFSLYDGYSVPKGLDDSLTFQGFNRERRGLGRHDNEGDYSHLGPGRFEIVIQSRQRLDEHVHTFVPVLVATRCEEIERVLGIKVIVTVEMTADEIVNLLLGLLVQVLEFVHGGEFLDVESIRQYSIRLSFQEVLALVCSDVRNGREHIGRVSGGPFDAISVIDAPFAGLSINVKVLQVVVEVDGAGAEVSTEEGGMSGKDGGDVHPPFLGQGECYTCKPFMEVGYDGPFGFVIHILRDTVSHLCASMIMLASYFSEEPSHEISKHHCLVGFVVTRRRGDACSVPKIRLPLIQPSITRLGVDKDDPGSALDQPSSVDDVNSSGFHGFHGLGNFRIRWGERFDLDGGLRSECSACLVLAAERIGERTEALLRGPMRVYRSPYSAVVTGALDLMTE